MKFFFQNPAGAWALLGVPALVLIHCLRVRAKEVRIPAIFLVERRDEAAPGRRFAKWVSSPLFWVQLLAVLLLSLLLMQPRFVASDSRNEVALVVDASASMGAFREETLSAARSVSEKLGRDAASTHWLLMPTNAGAPPLYVGESREAMLAALAAFRPSLGGHDFTDSLIAARRVLAPAGRVVLLTDHDIKEVPGGAELVSVGRPKDNVGFSGGVVSGDRRWRALVVNYSDAPAMRRRWIETPDGVKSEPVEVRLEPRGSVTLSGVVPADAFTVVMESDAFTADDRLPLVVPSPKRLAWRATMPSALKDIVGPALGALANAAPSRGGEKPDFEVVCAKTRDVAKGEPVPRILFLDSEGEGTKPSPAPCYAPSPDPLTDGLAWGVVPSFGGRAFATREGDRTLVRAGDRPLVALGDSAGVPELIFNYDPRAAFAGGRLPAVAVLISRFADRLRTGKEAHEALNTDCHAPLATPPGAGSLAVRADGKVVSVAEGAVLRAPDKAGFFTVSRGDAMRITGAAAFADSREADLTGATPAERLLSPTEARARGESVVDPLSVAGALVLLAVLLASWKVAARGRAE